MKTWKLGALFTGIVLLRWCFFLTLFWGRSLRSKWEPKIGNKSFSAETSSFFFQQQTKNEKQMEARIRTWNAMCDAAFSEEEPSTETTKKASSCCSCGGDVRPLQHLAERKEAWSSAMASEDVLLLEDAYTLPYSLPERLDALNLAGLGASQAAANPVTLEPEIPQHLLRLRQWNLLVQCKLAPSETLSIMAQPSFVRSKETPPVYVRATIIQRKLEMARRYAEHAATLPAPRVIRRRKSIGIGC